MSNQDNKSGMLPDEKDGNSTESDGGGDGAGGGGGDVVVPPDDDEPVGYRHPPKQYQFKPGRSGNPKGRPKGAPGLRKILEKEFAHRLEIREGGNRIKLSKLQVIVKRELEKAMGGDQRAIEHVIALNLQIFGLGEEGHKHEEELTLGEQLYLDAIMKHTGPLSDDEAGRDADPDFHIRQRPLKG